MVLCLVNAPLDARTETEVKLEPLQSQTNMALLPSHQRFTIPGAIRLVQATLLCVTNYLIYTNRFGVGFGPNT